MNDYPSILGITLIDAATNCARDGALATLTLKSGKEITGKLQRPTTGGDDTAHMKLDDGGWATVLYSEIAAVESRPSGPGRRGGW